MLPTLAVTSRNGTPSDDIFAALRLRASAHTAKRNRSENKKSEGERLEDRIFVSNPFSAIRLSRAGIE